MAKKKNPIEVAEWIESGRICEDFDAATERGILEACGNLLDDACASEIVGPGILFRATDGKHYTVSVEAVISEANPEWVRDVLDERAAEQPDKKFAED